MREPICGHGECENAPTEWPFKPTCYLVSRALTRASELQKLTTPTNQLQPHEDYLLMQLAAEVFSLRTALDWADTELDKPLMRDLKRYRRREPKVHLLVQEALHCADTLGLEGCLDSSRGLREAAEAVQSFVLQPSNVALDVDRKTGHLPGAFSDHTKNGNDSAVSHLSSVVEQRFRKPNDSQELPATSDTKPVNAGVRAEVARFAALMERELRANDHKGGWQADSPVSLVCRLKDETQELVRAIAGEGNVAAEAADVANFAMMIADVCGALPDGPAAAQPTAPKPVDGDVESALLLAEYPFTKPGPVGSAFRTLGAEVRRLRDEHECDKRDIAKLLAERDQLRQVASLSEAEMNCSEEKYKRIAAERDQLLAEVRQLKQECTELRTARAQVLPVALERDALRKKVADLSNERDRLARKLFAVTETLAMDSDDYTVHVGDVRRALFDTD